jgi:hypothetical protein
MAMRMGHAFLILDKGKERLIVVSTSCCTITKNTAENVFQHLQILKGIQFSKKHG